MAIISQAEKSQYRKEIISRCSVRHALLGDFPHSPGRFLSYFLVVVVGGAKRTEI